MKEFFKYVLATIVGFICVTAFMGIMSPIMFFLHHGYQRYATYGQRWQRVAH